MRDITKVHRLALDRLSDTEYICFARQVAGLIPSARVLHMGETAISTYKENIAKMADAMSNRPPNDCTVIRAELNEHYEDITATVNAFHIIQPTKEIADFISHLNKLVDNTNKMYWRRIRLKANEG